MNMSIRFRDIDKCKPTKEEMKLHIIENLIEKRFNNYNNTELKDSMYGNGSSAYPRFNEIYNWICKHVFEE